MREIIIDATPMFPKPTGVGFYVANLINSLHSLQREENFQLGVYLQPGLKKWLQGNYRFPEELNKYSPARLLPIPVRISDILIDKEIKSALNYFERFLESPHIIHGTNYTVYPCKKSLKVMSIYDLTFLKYPSYIDSVVKTYGERVKRCLKWTDLVITISESSKQDIVDYLNVEPEKVFVTPLASRYHSGYLRDEEIHILQGKVNYDFSAPYLLFVSTLEPRKNIPGIISAFNYLKEVYKIDHNLILIGRKGWSYEPILNEIENSPYRENIYHLDYLTDELVALFYSKADAFVYPSHYEGFGLPVLEAMTLGAPVVTSNTSSLPEVAGDAAVLVDPNDSIHIAEGILKIIGNSLFREELIRKGQQRAKLFTWENTARETLRAYRSAEVGAIV
jgi:glycosyltransferase involved in cell wall biosynthesis